MALCDLIFDSGRSATATLATVATLEEENPAKTVNCRTVATVTVEKVKIEFPVSTESIPEKQVSEGFLSATDGARQSARTSIKLFPLSWLREHRKELKAAGWTAKELYRRNKSKGFVWLSIWDRPGVEATIALGGIIEFRFNDNHMCIRQTARPMGYLRIKSKIEKLRCQA